MKLYIVSGMGADKSVFKNVIFPKNIEPVFLDWLLPEKKESLEEYTEKMAKSIDKSSDFYLLGYSFGGIIVQEIHKKYPAKKIAILGSMKSENEKSKLMRFAKNIKIYKWLPNNIFNNNIAISLAFFNKISDKRLPYFNEFFVIKDVDYLKWSLEQILHWKSPNHKEVLQVLASNDALFNPKNANPDFVINNGTHLFVYTKAKEVSRILEEIFI